MLALVVRGENSTTTTTETAFSIGTRCQKVAMETMTGDKNVETKAIDRFLDDCKASSQVDAWCSSNLADDTTPLISEECRGARDCPLRAKRRFPSPRASGRDAHQALEFGVLGAAVGCMLLNAWSWKVREKAALNVR
ncbi:hypothetical protein Gpo141_00000875 [Globisporangium polare]